MEEHTTTHNNNSNNNTYKGKNTKKGKGKGKQVDVMQTSPSQTPSTIDALWCNPDVEQKGWIMGVTIHSLSFRRRQAGAEYLLLDSGAQLHECPRMYPGHRVPLSDTGLHTASEVRLQHDG